MVVCNHCTTHSWLESAVNICADWRGTFLFSPLIFFDFLWVSLHWMVPLCCYLLLLNFVPLIWGKNLDLEMILIIAWISNLIDGLVLCHEMIVHVVAYILIMSISMNLRCKHRLWLGLASLNGHHVAYKLWPDLASQWWLKFVFCQYFSWSKLGHIN